jgi:hypothetical protein
MGIPAELVFRTKRQLGTDLLTDAWRRGARVHWYTADAVYGRDRGLRETCDARGIAATASPCPARFGYTCRREPPSVPTPRCRSCPDGPGPGAVQHGHAMPAAESAVQQPGQQRRTRTWPPARRRSADW